MSSAAAQMKPRMSFDEAVAAATAADPYPRYAIQVAAAPFDIGGPGRWIAAGARAVEHVLLAREFSVSAPIGTFAARTIRRNDGELHARVRPFVESCLAVESAEAASRAGALARALWATTAGSDAARVDALAEWLPTAAVAAFIGLDPFDRTIHRSAQMLARGLAAGAGDVAAALAEEAAADLWAHVPGNTDDERANAAALFAQAHDATAGLIGNTLLALASDARLAEGVRADRAALEAAVAETARFDAPVQNTRRRALADVVVLGHEVHAGDIVLVLLAAANRDPAANDDPARFAIDRPNRRCFTFGAGMHACPGKQLAIAIASAGVACVLGARTDLVQLARGASYQPSLNARIPRFSEAASRFPPS
jgi:cytochrome P450